MSEKRLETLEAHVAANEAVVEALKEYKRISTWARRQANDGGSAWSELLCELKMERQKLKAAHFDVRRGKDPE